MIIRSEEAKAIRKFKSLGFKVTMLFTKVNGRYTKAGIRVVRINYI